MKILTIVGARPQFVKAATVSHVLRSIGQREILVHTGQHYDPNMSGVFFKQLELQKPDYNLGIGSSSHGSQTGKMLEEIEKVLLNENPDWVLVYGDTNSTLAGALAAVKLHIPVAHVEAGLRSFNRQMPEEINRILTDHASDILFAPTNVAVENLCHEGISTDKIHFVGDVMYDAALYYGNRAETQSHILERLGLVPKGYILSTVHRAENTDRIECLTAIFKGLMQVAEEIPIVVPLHPRTRKALERANLLLEVTSSLQVIEPLGYLDMLMLEKKSCLIATDSGGVQKEAFFYQVPCVTLREETEWLELVEVGWNQICRPTSAKTVASTIQGKLWSEGCDINLFGAGNAAEKLVKIIVGDTSM